MPTILGAARGLGWRYMSLLVLAVPLVACAGAKDSRKHSYIYQADDNYVRLQPIESGAPANVHPFVISADQLRQLLAGIRVRRAAKMGETPAFSEEELKTIVAPLASALSKAGPNEDVTFAVTSLRGIFGKLSPKSVTTGRMFASGDSLHLIFGLMQARTDTGRLDQTGIDPEVVPGTRARRVESLWEIEPGRAELQDRRGDWLAFDRSAIPAAASAPRDAGPASGGENSAAQEIERRLRTLEVLREKGAITEQEYGERRRAILDQL